MDIKKDIFTEEDRKFMKLAFRAAEKGRGTTNPNPMVGAIIVKDGSLISAGYHKMAGTVHAEINAINAVKNIPAGAKMYVTLEPCSFYGRTPPCVDTLIKHKFYEVIISSLDPNPKVNGQGAEILRKAGIKVKTGLLEENAKEQNEIFFKQIKLIRPFICVKIASTIDGKLAAASGDSKWITGTTSRNMVQKLRFEYGCVLTGINTVIKDNPLLYPRKNISEKTDLSIPDSLKNSIITKDIIIEDINKNVKKKYTYSKFFRVILDSNLRIDLNSNIVKTAKIVKTIIFISKETQENKHKAVKIKQLDLLDIDVVSVNLNNNNPEDKAGKVNNHSSIDFIKNDSSGKEHLSLKEILNCLYNNYEITSVFVEAGPAIVTSFLKENLIDKFLIFLAPKIIGGGSSFNMFSDLNVKNIKDSLNLKFKRIKKIGDDFLLQAYPLN